MAMPPASNYYKRLLFMKQWQKICKGEVVPVLLDAVTAAV